MNKKRTSKIWSIPKDILQEIIDNSSTYKEILEKSNYIMPVSQGAYNRQLKQRINEDHLSLEQFNINNEKFWKKFRTRLNCSNKRDIKDYFCEHSTVGRGSVKKYIIEHNLIEYKCSKCGIGSIWNNKPITLHLDHINGVNNDNRLENLRFLCPNCHSQTKTYSGRNNNYSKKRICPDCGRQKSFKSNKCKHCFQQQNKNRIYARKFNPTKQELENILKTYNWNFCAVGRHYKVSDNAIRKRCKKLNIEK